MIRHVGGFSGSLTATTGTYDIQPTSDEEWVIVGVFCDEPCTLKITDGTNENIIGSVSEYGWTNLNLPISNGHYLQVLNDHTSTQVVSYVGYKQ